MRRGLFDVVQPLLVPRFRTQYAHEYYVSTLTLRPGKRTGRLGHRLLLLIGINRAATPRSAEITTDRRKIRLQQRRRETTVEKNALSQRPGPDFVFINNVRFSFRGNLPKPYFRAVPGH